MYYNACMKRRCFTLVEVLIAISLLSILLFALLSSYSQLKMIDTAIGKETVKDFEMRQLESRLEAAILQVLKAEDNKNFFYTEYPHYSNSPSLVFSYDAESRLDPRFSGPVLGRLFVDREGNLLLATWPSPKRYSQQPIPMQVEVLATGIQSVAFSFFTPEQNQWSSDWQKNTGTVPPLMKLHIVKESKEWVDFSFYLANNNYPLKL